MRFKSLSGTVVKDYNINLYDNMGHPLFSAHPNQNTDIIAIQFTPQALISDMSIWNAFEINTHTLTLEQMQRNWCRRRKSCICPWIPNESGI